MSIGSIPREDVARRALKAAKWNYLGVMFRIAIQLVAQIVLARMVGPTEFGYYMLAFMVVGIAYILAEFGLSSALVQAKNLTNDEVRRVWSHLLAASVVAVTAVFLLAVPLAELLGIPEAADYLRAATVPLAIQILSSVALGLLRKDLDFKRIQLAQVGGMLIGQVGVGFTLAWLLHSAWAILIGWTVQLAFGWAFMYARARHPLRLSLSPVEARFRRFGIGAWTANIANWSIENLDNILAGRYFGARMLGFYSVGYNLVRYPTNHLVTTLQTVMFPASAALQEDKGRLRSAYLAVLSLVALVTVPLFVAAATLAEPLIRLLYGPQWLETAGLMQPLALAMPLHAITAVSGPILWGIGRVGIESSRAWLTVAVFLVLVYVMGLATPTHLSWIVLAVYALRALLMTSALAGELQLPRKHVLATFSGALWLGAISAIGSFAAAYLIGFDRPATCIAVAVVSVLGTCLAAFWWLPGRIMGDELVRAMQAFRSRLPLPFVARLEMVANRLDERLDR